MNIISPSTDFDEKLIGLIEGYVVGITWHDDDVEHVTDVMVLGVTYDDDEFVRLEGAWAPEHLGYEPTTTIYRIRMADIDSIEIY